MKRIIVLILVAAMCVSITACGSDKKAFEKSSIAYDNINAAYELTLRFAEDFYRAWRIGVYEEETVQGNFADYLSEELSLSKDDIIEGMARQMGQAMAKKEWEELTQNEQDEYLEIAKGEFLWEGSVHGFLTYSVSNAYVANGTVETIQDALNISKEQMKELSEEYSDYEHYPNLKGYYTTTSSLLDFLLNPEGSFDMFASTVNEYMNTARDYKSDLAFIFED